MLRYLMLATMGSHIENYQLAYQGVGGTPVYYVVYTCYAISLCTAISMPALVVYAVAPTIDL